MSVTKTICLSFIVLLMGVAVTVLLHCNTIPDTVAYQEFNPDIHDAFIKSEWCYLFNTEYGYAETFGGVCSSVVVVEGDTTRFEPQDSIYMRISRIKDTVLVFNNTTYGDVRFDTTDIGSWSSVIYYLFTQQGFIGQTLVSFLDSADYVSMITILAELDSLTDYHKMDVVNAFNAMVTTPDFYFQYRKQFPPTVSYEKLSNQINRLVAEGIMLDTTGAVKNSLSFYETEMLKWFNVELIVRYLDTPPAVTLPKMLNNFLNCGHVYKMVFEKSASSDMADALRITRFISKCKNLLSQPAYIDHNNTTCTVSETTRQKISDIPVLSSSSASSLAPLYWSDNPIISTEELGSLLETGHATFTYLKDGISNADTSWYCMKLYYSFTGQITREDRTIDVTGIIYSNIYLNVKANISTSNTILDAGIKTWDTETEFCLSGSDGKQTVYRKCSTVHPL